MAPLVIAILLFDGYETLDAHGPIQFLGGRPVIVLLLLYIFMSRFNAILLQLRVPYSA